LYMESSLIRAEAPFIIILLVDNGRNLFIRVERKQITGNSS
jgi:hypothetical protein